MPFSCKRGGFCPSCGARRMADSAALLVDEILPFQPMLQLAPGMARSGAMQEQVSRVIPGVKSSLTLALENAAKPGDRLIDVGLAVI